MSGLPPEIFTEAIRQSHRDVPAGTCITGFFPPAFDCQFLPRFIDRLQVAGLVLRSPHPTDGRTTLIELTPEGRTLAKRATAVLNAEVFGRSGFAEQDVDELIRILGNFRRNAGDFTTEENKNK